MKKLVGIVIASMMLFAVAGNAMASYAPGEIIQVVYKAGDKEKAFSLSGTPDSWGINETVGTHTFGLENFAAGTGYSDLKLAFYSSKKTNGGLFKEAWVATAENTVPEYYPSAFLQFNSGFESTAYLYASDDNPLVTANNSYFKKMNLSGQTTGLYSNLLRENAEATVSADSVMMYLWYITETVTVDPESEEETLAYTINQLATLTLYGDGRTIANVSAVPVPGAIWLLGSAVLGMVGLRRKNG